eukprot:1169508-Amorphochlora_amoeboformis.AAC.1
MYYELLADRLLTPNQPLVHTRTQNLTLSLLLQMADMPDALQVLSENWVSVLQAIPTRLSRDPESGSVSEYVKTEFHKVIERFLPILSLYSLPRLVVGINDEARTKILRNLSKKEPLDVLVNDGVSRGNGRLFRPFRTRDVMFDLEIG